jgi:germination protein M
MRVKALLLLLLCVAAALPAGASSSRTTRVGVYFVRGERVQPVGRTVTVPSVARGALLALLRGPSATERRQGYATTIPAGVTVRGVSITGGVARVDLSRRFESGGGSLSMLLRVAQVVHTMTQFTSVQRVQFRLDGDPVDAIGGEGVVVVPAIGRGQVEGQAPPILVERPLPGDRIRGAISVRGTANVFEARLFVDVVSPTGRLLAHRAVLASAGSGIRGRFETAIPLVARPPAATVIAYASSAKNGARIDVVRVPITLAPG